MHLLHVVMTPNTIITTTRSGAVRPSEDENLLEALRGPSAAWVAAALAQAESDPIAAAIDAATLTRVLLARASAFLDDEMRARVRDAVNGARV